MIGDQTGDGLPDAWTGWDQRVYAAPVTFGDGTMTSSAVVAADGDLSSLLPMPFDLDADGLTDFVGLDTDVDASEVHTSVGAPIDPETGEVLVVVPSASLASPSYATAWDIAGRSFTDRGVFLEDGTVSVLVIGRNEVVVVDLGAGTRP